jgi:hypothetical protein
MSVGQFGCTAFVHKVQVLQQQAETKHSRQSCI